MEQTAPTQEKGTQGFRLKIMSSKNSLSTPQRKGDDADKDEDYDLSTDNDDEANDKDEEEQPEATEEAASPPNKDNTTTTTPNNISRKRKKKTVIADIDETPVWREKLAVVAHDADAKAAAATELQAAQAALKAAQARVAAAQQAYQAAETSASNSAADLLQGVTGPWMTMYRQLEAYHAKHGTCKVRGEAYKELRQWTLRQRERYHLPASHKQKLPWYLAQCLDKLHFPWNYRDDPWKQQYQALIAYKQVHGDCLVPRGYKQDPTLAHWVKRMRYEAAKFRKGDAKAKITAEQVHLLDDIDFCWDNLSRTWEERFAELQAFQQQHGHANVPATHDNTKLVTWCQNQRAHYRAFMLGKKTYMTAPRKAQLEAAGFDWDFSATRRNKQQQQAQEGDEGDDDDDDEEEEQPAEVVAVARTAPYAQPFYANPAFQRAHYGV